MPLEYPYLSLFKTYAGQDGQQVLKAVMGVLSDVEKVLEVILGAVEEERKEAA